MNGNILKRARLLISMLILCGPLAADELQPLTIPLTLPQSAAAASAPVEIKVSLQCSRKWSAGTVTVRATAHTEVVDTKLKSVSGLPATALEVKPGAPSKLALTFAADGEFLITLTAAVDTPGGRLQEISTVGVIVYSGRVWMAEGEIEAVLAKRTMAEVRASMLGAKEAAIEEAFRTKLTEVRKLRAEKTRERSRPARAPRVAAADFNTGDTLHFKGQWRGPDPTDAADPASTGTVATFANFGMHGVKVTAADKADPAKTVSTYLIGGRGSFAAPSKDFTLTLELSFPGITAGGAINTAGGGIGNFITEDLAGNVYQFAIDAPLPFLGKTAAEADAAPFLADGTAARGGVNFGLALAVYHGAEDMVEETLSALGVNKAGAFRVTFPEPGGTSFFGGDKKLHITSIRAYVWDVIGHEFGHMVQDDTGAINAAGGSHDGSNQYTYATNASTLGNKLLSNRLALNEGYGTWIGVAFTERSSRYKGKLKWVGDKKYRDLFNTELNDTGFKGEDTELAIQQLLWDLHDANNEAYPATGLKDTTSLTLKGLYQLFVGKAMNSIFNVWEEVAGKPLADLTAASGIPSARLKKALAAANSFAEFGIAPHLQAPAAGDKIDLTKDAGPKIKWRQLASGSADMDLNKFTILLYSNDYTGVLWSKAGVGTAAGRAQEYELTKPDLEAIKAAVMGKDIASVILVISGSADKTAPATGPYLSNGVELLLQDYNRAAVLVVDSSGSNTSTDPSRRRVAAAKTTLSNLVSQAEATANGTVPDIASGVTFTTSASVLSGWADPDAVIPAMDGVFQSGGTSIDSGINTGVGLLDSINAGGFIAFIRDKAAIVVLTDGENNAGPAPVIAAIAAATAKGIRTHYGFLSPFFSPSPLLGRVPRGGGLPATIEDAVRQSGGIYARIGDADSQVAFIQQIYANGLTNSDGTDPGGLSLVGQTTTTDGLTSGDDMRAFRFRGRENENISVRVDTGGTFRPFVTLFDSDGDILAVGSDDDDDGRVTFAALLPETAEYVVEVYSDDGRFGQFTIFIDVVNVPGNGPVNITASSAPVLDRQTGLYRQTVTLTASVPGAGFRLVVDGLNADTSLYNLSGTDAGGHAYVQWNEAVAAGEVITLVLEYYATDLSVPVPVLSVEAAGAPTATPAIVPFSIDTVVRLANGEVLLEFASDPGARYLIQYSDDNTVWKSTGAPLTAGGTRVQWRDTGPPKSSPHPSAAHSRFYRAARVN